MFGISLRFVPAVAMVTANNKNNNDSYFVTFIRPSLVPSSLVISLTTRFPRRESSYIKRCAFLSANGLSGPK